MESVMSASAEDHHVTGGTIITSQDQLQELPESQSLYTLVKSASKSLELNQAREFFKIRYDPDVFKSSSVKLDFRTNLTEKVRSISTGLERPTELNILQWQGRGFSSTWTLKREAREGDEPQSLTRPEDDTNNRALQIRKWYRRKYKRLSAGSDLDEKEKEAAWTEMMTAKSDRASRTDNWYAISSNLASRNWYYDSKIEEVQNVSSVIPHFEYSYPHHNPGKVYPKKVKIEKSGTKKKKKK